MSSIRIYQVERRDGYGRIEYEIVPAHSKENAESYFDNTYIKSTATFLGFEKVSISYNGQEFYFSIKEYTFHSNSTGYDYLYNYMKSSLNSFIASLQQQGLYPPY